MTPSRTKAMDDLVNLLDKIDGAAEDGQNGSATYAMDRLRLIRRLCESGQEKLRRAQASDIGQSIARAQGR